MTTLVPDALGITHVRANAIRARRKASLTHAFRPAWTNHQPAITGRTKSSTTANRLQIHVGDAGARLYTMSGYDWTDRYPSIVTAASKLKRSMILDAEAVIQRPDGVSDFEALHNRQRNGEAFAYVFDLLMLDGVDRRVLPWQLRRKELDRLFRRSRSGLILSLAVIGQGQEVYEAACGMSLEGIVSKRIDAPYRSGRSTAWLKIKNPNAPAVLRLKEERE